MQLVNYYTPLVAMLSFSNSKTLKSVYVDSWPIKVKPFRFKDVTVYFILKDCCIEINPAATLRIVTFLLYIFVFGACW